MTHGGYARTGRTDGGLAGKIAGVIHTLQSVPESVRNEAWMQAWESATAARTLLADGRRAKAGKVLLPARQYLES